MPVGADPYSTAALAGIQVWSGIQQAAMVKDGAALQGRIDEFNAKLKDYDAWQTKKFTEEQVSHQETQDQQVLSQQTTQIAAQDVDTHFGTASAVQNEGRLNSLLNQLDVRQAGAARALGITRQAQNIRLGIGQNELEAAAKGSAALTEGVFGALGTVGSYGASKYGYTKGKG